MNNRKSNSSRIIQTVVFKDDYGRRITKQLRHGSKNVQAMKVINNTLKNEVIKNNAGVKNIIKHSSSI